MKPHEPETETQRTLVGIWREVLQAGTVGLDDPFFAIGGDSLLALQVYDRIRLRYKREFPLFDLSAPPTIRSLAAVIDNELAGTLRNEYRSLQRLQTGDPSAAPLFLVHGGDGNARVFQRLVKNLDPRLPLYAFRWPGWDGQRAPETLEAMADAYEGELLRFRPGGPVRIGGYCIGGVVALELARRLRDRGIEVADPVFIWDCPNLKAASYRPAEPWHVPAEHARFQRMVAGFNALRRETKRGGEPLEAPAGIAGRFDWLRRHPALFALARNAQVCLASLPLKLRLAAGKTIPIKRRWTACMVACFNAAKRQAIAPYGGPVVYFRSDVLIGRPMNLQGWWDDPFLGFKELCVGEFNGYVVGGDHVDVLAQPEGAAIVNRICFSEEP